MEHQPARIIPYPSFENLRLRNLRQLGLLDSAHDPALDELVRIATEIAGTPIGALSLLDQDRQWFKAKIGIDITETARNISFCTYTILNADKPLIVNNALDSEVFRENPLVVAEPHIRAYVGFPLNSPDFGFTIGSLCVIDQKPRLFTDEQLRLLAEVSISVSRTLFNTSSNAQSKKA